MITHWKQSDDPFITFKLYSVQLFSVLNEKLLTRRQWKVFVQQISKYSPKNTDDVKHIHHFLDNAITQVVAQWEKLLSSDIFQSNIKEDKATPIKPEKISIEKELFHLVPPDCDENNNTISAGDGKGLKGLLGRINKNLTREIYINAGMSEDSPYFKACLQALAINTSVRILTLFNIYQLDLELVVQMLQKNTSITHFYLLGFSQYYTHITAKSKLHKLCLGLADKLRKNTSLITLYLEGDTCDARFDDEDFSLILEALVNNTTLKCLFVKLAINKIDQKIFSSLSRVLDENKTIEYIVLDEVISINKNFSHLVEQNFSIENIYGYGFSLTYSRTRCPLANPVLSQVSIVSTRRNMMRFNKEDSSDLREDKQKDEIDVRDLHTAAAKGNLDFLRRNITNKNLNSLHDKTHQTLLMIAARKGYVDVVNYLLTNTTAQAD